MLFENSTTIITNFTPLDVSKYNMKSMRSIARLEKIIKENRVKELHINLKRFKNTDITLANALTKAIIQSVTTLTITNLMKNTSLVLFSKLICSMTNLTIKIANLAAISAISENEVINLESVNITNRSSYIENARDYDFSIFKQLNLFAINLDGRLLNTRRCPEKTKYIQKMLTTLGKTENCIFTIEVEEKYVDKVLAILPGMYVDYKDGSAIIHNV